MKRRQAKEAATVFMERHMYGPRETWGGAHGTHRELTRLFENQATVGDYLLRVASVLLVIVVVVGFVGGLMTFGFSPPPTKCVEVER